MTEAAFKYTFPIVKSEAREDGNFITGYASGPEIDSENERFAPEAIQRFSEQINTASPQMRLTYRDAHAPDGVLRDLGEITKAWVEENFHLGIEVKLDMANPASAYLWRQINDKGKQYGMSVAGRVIDYVDEFVASANTVIRTYKNVVLDEISNTTRPAWYPSFGTVLSKSIKDASSSDAPDGDNRMGEQNSELLDETVEDAEKSESAEGAEDETQKTDDTEAEAEVEKAEESESGDEGVAEDDVEKAGKKVSTATANRLLGLFNEMQTALTDLGVIETAPASEKSASDEEEDTVEKSEDESEATAETITKAELDALADELRKANERIAELEARPHVPEPGAITDDTKKAADEFADVFEKASPSEKMRLAFAAHTGGK